LDVVSQITSTAQAYGVDPRIALEVALRESRADPNVRDGAAGEIGIYQIEPATGVSLGYSVAQLRDPVKNIEAGNKYLAQLFGQFGDAAEAIAAYNDGPGAVSHLLSQYGADWFSHLPGSTQDYVTTVLNNVNSGYSAQPGGTEFQSAVGGISISTIGWIIGAAVFVALAIHAQEN
jgi:soluble lytic murein transglycosylase-like protein